MLNNMKIHFSLILLFYFMGGQLFAQETNPFNETLSKVDELYYENNVIEALYLVNSTLDSSTNDLSLINRIKYFKWQSLLNFDLDYLEEAKLAVLELYNLEDDFKPETVPFSSTEYHQFANQILKSIEKDYVFVNKHKQDKDFVPANVTVYSKEDINKIGARDLMDLLRITSGFMEIGDNNERNFATRGVFGTTVQDVLILINGHNINDLLSSTNAPDWLALDYIEQIEVVRGPGSALFGGNAFSGVINIVTKTGKSFDDNSVSLWHGSGAQSGLGLFNERSLYRLNHQFGKKIGKKEEFYISSTIYSFGGSEISHQGGADPNVYPDINPVDSTIISNPITENKSEYVNQYTPSYNFLGVYKNKSLTITANAQSSTLVFSRPFSQNLWLKNSGEYITERRSKTDKRNFIEISKNIFQNSKVFRDNLTIKASYDHFQKDLYNPSTSDNTSILSRLSGNEHRGKAALEYATDQWGFNNQKSYSVVGFQSAINTWFYKQHTSPGNGHLVDVSSQNFFGPSEGKRYETNAGLYVQTEQTILPNSLLLTFGARFNYHDQYARLSDSIRWGHHFSPRLAIVYIPKIKFKEKSPLKFKCFYNSAFLPPPFLYRKGGIPAFESDSNLTTQNVETIEGLIFGDIGANFSYSINFYRNSIDNFITKIDDIYKNDINYLRVINGLELNVNYNARLSEKFGVKWFANSTHLELLKHEKLTSNDKSIFKTFGNVEEENLMWMPNLTFNSGVTIDYDFAKDKKTVIGFRYMYYGEAMVNRRYFSTGIGGNTWEFNSLNEELDTRHILDFNIMFKSYFYEFGLVVKNALNQRNYLPALASPSGRVMGESRVWYLTFKYSIGGNK